MEIHAYLSDQIASYQNRIDKPSRITAQILTELSLQISEHRQISGDLTDFDESFFHMLHHELTGKHPYYATWLLNRADAGFQSIVKRLAQWIRQEPRTFEMDMIDFAVAKIASAIQPFVWFRVS